MQLLMLIHSRVLLDIRIRYVVLLVVTMSAAGVQTSQAGPIVPVRPLYLVPADRAPNPAYADAIDMAVLDLQTWYAGELAGDTFAIATPRVEVVPTAHPASYYSTTPHAFEGTTFDFFFNVLDDAMTFGVLVDDPAFRWAVYIDAEPAPGQSGGAALPGVAIIGAEDLRGLTGQEPAPVDRWIGGLGHELGHTFGLPHPNDCVAPVAAPGCPYGALNYPPEVIAGALMQFGYLTYPDTYLLPEERQLLRSTPYFGPLADGPSVPEPATLVLLLAGAAASVRRLPRRTRAAMPRVRSTRTAPAP